MKILINAVIAKKRSGGGFQVCINFIQKTLEHKDIDWYYIVSEELDKEISVFLDDYRGDKFYSFPTQPDFLHSYLGVRKAIKQIEKDVQPDVVFSILAPSYFTFSSTEVMRYTFPWVTHPNSYAWRSLPLKKYVRTKLYCIIQRHLMRKAHYFITQSETCATGIKRITHEPSRNVIIIPNVLPAFFYKYNTEHIETEGKNIICVGSAYYHKNIDIVPDVIKELKQQGYKDIKFHLTLPQDSSLYYVIQHKAELYGIEGNIINHGVLTQTELGIVYRQCDFSFIPSLLEVFSASMVEAMWFGLPTVASNFDFNRDVLGDSCLYFEPTSAHDASVKFKTLFEKKELCRACKERMSRQMEHYSDFDSYFNNTKEFLIQAASRNDKR